MVPVEKRDAATLIPLIKRHILPGTTIVSDCWKAYDCLPKEGFQHLKVNHSLNFVDPTTGAHSNTIESTWRHAKAVLPTYRRHKPFFAGYLAKYLFLKKCRQRGVDPTIAFFNAAGELFSPGKQYATKFQEGESEDEDDFLDDDDVFLPPGIDS